MPAWAQMELYTTTERNDSLAYNRQLAAKANASGIVHDVVFMGAPLAAGLPGGAVARCMEARVMPCRSAAASLPIQSNATP